ncbi:MAG: AAA family ATPase [Alteraurantiacibacter sp.]
MNDPKNQPIDIEEQHGWLVEHKEATGQSWTQLSRSVQIPTGTLSQFGGKTYKGDLARIADAVFRYRQTLASQAALRVEAPEIPGYYPTETSDQLVYLLKWAQRGRIVTAALGAGLGKTTTAKHFKACNSNVFHVVCSPSCAGTHNLQHRVLWALGSINNTGSMQTLTFRIQKLVEGMGSPLLILDEAQHLTVKALEEARSWHDATGLGIALLGNESILQRLEGGSRSAEYAQMFSRQAMKMVRSTPLNADIEALLDAWDVRDAKVCALLHTIARKPGGLRGATFVLELSKMIAIAERSELAEKHIQDAWAQLSTRAGA